MTEDGSEEITEQSDAVASTAVAPSPETYLQHLRCSAGTDVGLRREENQDAFGIVKKDRYHAYIVADGMGGVKGGGIASRLAIAIVEEELAKCEDLSVDRLVSAVQNANTAIHEKGGNDPNLSGMGTTLVGLVFSATGVVLINVGDSRAYRFRRGTIRQLSEDHTLVGELIRSGAISKEQAANHPVSHMLTRSLGPVQEVQVDCKELSEPAEAGDVYLLCSDGLYGLVSEREILAILRESSLDEASQSLIALSNDRGGNDNITLILVSVGEHKELLRQPSEQEVSTKAAAEAPKEVRVAEPESADRSSDADAQLSPLSQPGATIASGAVASGLDEQQGPTVEGRLGRQSGATADKVVEADSKPSSAATASVGWTVRPASLMMGLLLVAALLLGLIVGRLFDPGLGDEGVIVSDNAALNIPGVPEPSKEVEPERSGIQADATEVRPEVVAPVAGSPAPENDDPPEQIRPDGADLGRLVKTRESFEASLKEVESQLSAFDRPISGEVATIVSEGPRRAAAVQSRIRKNEEEVAAATRKLSLWFSRQQRLDREDPMRIAIDVGTASPEVKRRYQALTEISLRYSAKYDELEQYPSNTTLKMEVEQLREDRANAKRELSDAIRKTVREVLDATDQEIAELKFSRDLLTREFERVNERIEFAKALTSPDKAVRLKMRERLEQKRQGLVESIAELSLVINSRAASSSERRD
jgi:protein phosphatase